MSARKAKAVVAIGSLLLAAALTACSSGPSKAEQEAARNTFACRMNGERLVVRFDIDEARLLLPGGERMALYRVSTAAGARYSNGNYELRGVGAELTLTRHGERVLLEDCAPYTPPPG